MTGEDAWENIGLIYKYSFRNPETPTDFEVTKTTDNLLNFFNSKSDTGVKTLMPNSAYSIEIRAVYNCTGTDQQLTGEADSVDGITAPYPPQDVVLTPVDEQNIEMAWTVVSSPQVLTYDILQCDTNYSSCSVLAADVTMSPQNVSGKVI